MVLARPQLPAGLRDQALTAHLQALAGLRDEDAGPAAGAILAAPGQHDSHATAAARLAAAVMRWDSGQISDSLELLRDAARHGTGISPDARHPQPLLALAAALVDLRQLAEAEDILHAADNPALHGIPAQAGLSILRARIHLAAGRPEHAAAEGQAALAIAAALGADGYAATAHRVLAMIELRRGDIAAAAQHLAGQAGPGPQFADVYARPETTMAAGPDHRSARRAGRRPRPRSAGSAPTWRPGPGSCSATPLLRPGWSAPPWPPATPSWPPPPPAPPRPSRTPTRGSRPWPRPRRTAAAWPARDPALLAEAAAQHPDPWARASAAEDLGVLHGRHGDRDQAIRHLKAALGGYRQAGADRDQARIRRRLRQLGIRRRHWATQAARPLAGWDSLTGTEQAVAGLVAEGLNNNQVAARMYISTHTVAHHLRQAFRKLAIASRVELTRIVIEHAADGPLGPAARRCRTAQRVVTDSRSDDVRRSRGGEAGP